MRRALAVHCFRGEIPAEVGALVDLKNLNLSTNRLSGHIPEIIGSMGSLESIDSVCEKISDWMMLLKIKAIGKLAEKNQSPID
ncbi:hypothetical protein ACP70R_041902 [Stipagrostis hirtigluma subsp. patula]